MTHTSGCLLAALLLAPFASAAEPAPAPREKAPPKMPLSGLAAAKPMFDACVYRYPVGTTNPECQAFVDQGLGQYYSYVWIEAARAFETAVQLDPECAYAWLMLHRSLDKWGKPGATPSANPYVAALGGMAFARLPDRVGKNASEYALDTARRLMPAASPREKLHIQSRLQEKGMWPGTGPDERRKKACQSLDELLMLHEDDEEGWFWRAQLASGDGPNAGAVFYKALLRVNPLHPGANHEFVHFYENVKRPALGWPHAEAYIKSSPGIPHAHHMQAHLGTRIGKWGETTDWSAKAVELQIAYHKLQGVTPGEDHQFNHHMDILSKSLVHDGRFSEARAHRTLCESYQYTFRLDWLRAALGQRDWAEAAALVEQFRKSDKATGAYYAALVSLEKGDAAQAGREVDTLRQLLQSKKSDRGLERKLWEVQGRHLCQTGEGAAGLALLKKVVDATKNDFLHHAWGNGAVFMESWGVGALDAGDAAAAEEAFGEALAHDAGSARGALGLWAVCDRLGRGEEAARYLKLAHRVWSRADTKDFAALQADLAQRARKIARPGAAAATSE